MNSPLFVPSSTNDDSVKNASKSLLMTNHGWGKTTTCKHYQNEYGRGLILSGESGLKSLSDVKIDYIHFSSYNGEHDPASGVYSFKGIMDMINTPAFKQLGYTWICVDSLTELGDQVLAAMEEKHKNNKNRFDVWTDYARCLIGACKWVRDLPMHVLVTCLAGEETDENGNTVYWPLIPSSKTPRKIPGIFDYVFCGVRKEKVDQQGKAIIDPATGRPIVERFVISDEFRGWPGKTRDPYRRIAPVEKQDNIVMLLKRIDMSEQEYEQYLSKTSEQ